MEPSSLLRQILTSAKPERPFPSDPEKITSSEFFPRKSLRLCSPKTHRMASARLDFPDPFGPTIAVIGQRCELGGRNESSVFLAKVLNPWSSSFVRCIVR